jgi:hypothetical protein
MKIKELLENLDEKRKIIEKLKRIIFLEKNSLSIAKTKNDEMACLLVDQKATIDSLMKLKQDTGLSSRSRGMKASMEELNALLTRRRGTGVLCCFMLCCVVLCYVVLCCVAGYCNAFIITPPLCILFFLSFRCLFIHQLLFYTWNHLNFLRSYHSSLPSSSCFFYFHSMSCFSPHYTVAESAHTGQESRPTVHTQQSLHSQHTGSYSPYTVDQVHKEEVTA